MDIRILQLLWRTRETADPLNEGSTAHQIQAALGLKDVGPVYDSIKRLIARERDCGWRCLAWDAAKRRGKSPDIPGGRGPRPKAYRIIAVGMADWSSSAFLLLELACFPSKDRRIEAGKFTTHMIENCCFLDQSEIDNEIKYLAKHGYVEKEPPNKEHGYRYVLVGDRTRSERDLLKMIAAKYQSELAKDGKAMRLSYYDPSKGTCK